jgi:hypothetical protein
MSILDTNCTDQHRAGCDKERFTLSCKEISRRMKGIMSSQNVPMPDLQIVPIETLLAHEEHDSQRSQPLIERLRYESCIINPPIVAPTGEGRYVILDGANRVFAFRALGYPHLLVQLAPYESGLVELDTWHHIICNWNAQSFLEELKDLPELQLSAGNDNNGAALAEVHLRDDDRVTVTCPVKSLAARNAASRRIVSLYQRNAVLQRTTLTDLEIIWGLHPSGEALIQFRRYLPQEILDSAMHDTPLPPGVSRHIVHGRAIRVNYPIARLRDMQTSLEVKNAQLLEWVREKVANRHVRYYAEATFQFDE